MTPDDPMVTAIPAVLEPMRKKLAKKLRKARRGDPEAVHDARILLRRVRVGLEVMGRTSFDPARTGRVARALRHIERALGPARDDDALLEHLNRWIGRDGGRSEAVEPLRDRVRKRRAKHLRALGRKRAQSSPALRRLRALIAHPDRATVPPPKNASRAAPTLVRHFVHDVTWRAYEEVLAYDTRAADDLEVIHKFRSACRRLRFTLELFEGATRDASAALGPLQALQSRLGDLHDHVVVIARGEDWMARSRLPRTRAIAGYVAQRARARDAMLAEFDEERRAVTALSFRVALFRALNGV